MDCLKLHALHSTGIKVETLSVHDMAAKEFSKKLLKMEDTSPIKLRKQMKVTLFGKTKPSRTYNAKT